MTDPTRLRVYISGPAEWIAKRRELLAVATEGPWAPWLDQDGASHMAGLLMVGNAAAVIPEGETWIDGVEVGPVAHVYTPEDRALITDARTALPRALDALEAVLDGHRPVSFTFSWRDGITMHEVCDTCQDKAGVHPCGCWRAEDVPHLCAVCSDPEHRMEAPWPCMTVQAIEAALRGES